MLTRFSTFSLKTITSVLVSERFLVPLSLQVIGTDKLPDYKERSNFPFTIATIHETLRINTVGKLLMMQFVQMLVQGSRKTFH